MLRRISTTKYILLVILLQLIAAWVCRFAGFLFMDSFRILSPIIVGSAIIYSIEIRSKQEKEESAP